MPHLAFFAHVFHHGGQPSNCQHSGSMAKNQTLFASRWTTPEPAHDPSRANKYINERLHLKSHLPASVPHLSFCVRGKFCHLAQGGLIVVKGSDERKIF
ncbi:hypothetical protein TNCV_4793161 [Trichonephila clavipes]|nr:hypothetical protein TNCV_4793161 [Trichonephila clavipes]